MTSSAVEPLIALAIEEGGTAQATIFGRRERVPASTAALVNGAAGHSLDFDDIDGEMYGHPSVVLVPALFAVAESIGASGEDVVCAYVAGLEVATGIGRRVNPSHYDAGWHATSTIGSLAAAAAVARLLQLPAERMQHAIGIAASQAAGPRRQFGTDVKSMHAGLAARAGVQGAVLAARGMKADPVILDGEGGFGDLYGAKQAADVASPYAPQELALTSRGLQVKRHACCAATHTSIDAMLRLVAEHSIRPETIASIECEVSPLAVNILKYHAPQTPLEAKFSVEFCVALAALAGDCGIRQFTQARVDDETLRKLASRVVVRSDPAMPRQGTTPCRMSIRLADGRQLSAEVARPRGSPDQPLSREELRRKFMECACLRLSQGDAAALFDRILDLPSVANVREIVKPCARYLPRARLPRSEIETHAVSRTATTNRPPPRRSQGGNPE